MERNEFEDRKPMLWAMFAAAALASTKPVEAAAKAADHMTDTFEGRFVRDAD